MKEVRRVLRPGGTYLMIQEPVCRRWIYPLMYKLANREGRGPDYGVHEDVLVWPKLTQMAQEEGFSTEIEFYPPPIASGLLGTYRKAALLTFPFLKKWTFSMADLAFKKL